LGGGRATKEHIASAICSFVWFFKSQLLCGVCVSQKQDDDGKYGGVAYCIFLLYNMQGVDLPTFSCCALGNVESLRRLRVSATRHCPMENDSLD
jgi:hypothetical protein